jgi:small subunit ribosomal protein S20
LDQYSSSRRKRLTAGSLDSKDGDFLEENLVANVASAEKKNRQRLKRRARNLSHLSTMRTHVKRVRAALECKDGQKAADALKIASRVIDKAAQKGVIPRKTASRKISRLTQAVARLSA